jgi:dTMP kinase
LLITFEGIDGSGKTTQINLLKKKLEQSGVQVFIFREPGGTEVSEFIRGILLNPEVEIDPITEILLFSAARSQLIAEKVKPLNSDDKVIILDRFYDSTVAYQGYGRSSINLDDIHHLNQVASHGLKPDVTFYLRVSLEVAEARRSSFTKDRMERAGNTFYEKVIQGFDDLSKKEERIKVIDASRSTDEISEDIWLYVKYRIK